MTRIGDETVDSFLHASKGAIGATALQLTTTSSHAGKGVQIKAAADNSGIVYVGLVGVTADSAAATDGFPLSAGDGVCVPIDDPSKIYVIASGAGQKVFYLVV